MTATLHKTRTIPDGTADLLTQVRDIAPLLRDEAGRIEALGRLTPAVLDALHARGLYRMLLPRHLNGYGCGIETFVKAMEILAAADASPAWCVGQASGCSMAAAYVEPADGMAAVTGGGEVFNLFLNIGFDAFHLSRAGKLRLPGGRPVFPQVPALTPEELLAKHGLLPGPIQVLDPEAEATLVTWKPQR